MQTLRRLILAAGSILLMAPSAHASFHFMQIEQVIGGVYGDASAQAIQLRMRAGGQNLVQQSRLIVRDATGANPVTLVDITMSVPNAAAGSRVLIATPDFAKYCGITPNFIMAPIPPAYLAAGSLTFESDPPGPIIYWRLSWGGAGYTGPGTGSVTNDADGNFSPPFPSALPSNSDQALRFPGPANALSTNNAADYVITPGPATFVNNAGQSCTLDLGLDLFTTPPGGTTVQSFAATPLPPGFFGPGSDPFQGTIVLGGQPIAPLSPLGPTDTIVERLSPPVLPAPGSTDIVPIEIVALNLVSVNPITVTYNGGMTPEQWDVRVCLSSAAPQPTGQLELRAGPCNFLEGGTFQSQLPVLPRFTFTRIGPPAVQVLDFGAAMIPPIQFTGRGHWSTVDPGLGLIQVPPGLTVDHDCSPVTPNVGPLPGTTPDLLIGLRVVRCDPASCDPPVGIVKRMTHEEAMLARHGVLPAQHCPSMSDTDADGICDDADNCRSIPNPLQQDSDDDGVGDVCDNCVTLANFCQEDNNLNGIGDRCEATSVEPALAGGVQLGAPAPNPTRGGLGFTVNLPRGTHVRVGVFDVRGARVNTLVDRTMGAGLHHMRWDAAGLESGTYYLRLEAEGVQQSRKFTFVR